MKVVVLGPRGQLGAAVVYEFRDHHDVTPLDRAALDITNADAVREAMDRLEPAVIINCTGYNAVDAAEQEPVAALQTNAFAVRSLARAAQAVEAMLVHYGSDFVFDGTAHVPYTEEDRPNPRSVYAASKMLGEWFAVEAPKAYVFRVESLFGRAPDGPPAKGSVESIVQALRSGGSPKVFEDRTVSPTYVPDAARATRELVERGAPFGLYHCVNSASDTWLELAREAAALMGVEFRCTPVRLADVKLPAERPLYCALSNEKLSRAGFVMPSWQDALRRHLTA